MAVGIQIFVQESFSGRTHTVGIEPSDDISEIESRIAEKTNIAKGDFYLLATGKVLRPGFSAADCGITQHATLYLHGIRLTMDQVAEEEGDAN